MFLNPRARTTHPDRPEVAADAVRAFRLSAGPLPVHARVRELVDELSEGSEDFARLWSRQEVHDTTPKTKRFRHSSQGLVSLDDEVLAVAGSA